MTWLSRSPEPKWEEITRPRAEFFQAVYQVKRELGGSKGNFSNLRQSLFSDYLDDSDQNVPYWENFQVIPVPHETKDTFRILVIPRKPAWQKRYGFVLIFPDGRDFHRPIDLLPELLSFRD